MNLKFDHSYTADPKYLFMKKLKKLGFLLLPDEVEHPDRHFCRFIAFRESLSEQPVYLEFIDARDPKKPVQKQDQKRHPSSRWTKTLFYR